MQSRFPISLLSSVSMQYFYLPYLDGKTSAIKWRVALRSPFVADSIPLYKDNVFVADDISWLPHCCMANQYRQNFKYY